MPAVLNNPITLDYFVNQTKEALSEICARGIKRLVTDNGQDYVIMPSEKYEKLIDELADIELDRLAAERLAEPNVKWLTEEEFDAALGFTEEDLAGWEDVEIE